MSSYFFEGNHLHKIKAGLNLALFLDFDGTLVPIQKDPAKCFLSKGIKRQLKLLANSKNVYLTILSGRALSDIGKRVGIRKIYYGGNHGLDIFGPGVRYTHPKAMPAKPIINHARQLLQKKIKNIKGAWLEDKKFTLSLHFRSVKKNNIPLVKKVFYRTVAGFLEKTFMTTSRTKEYENSPSPIPLPQGEGVRGRVKKVFSGEKLLTVIKGKKVLELVPNVSWDKGRAVMWLLKQLKGKRLPIYIGDDQTDETAFKALRRKGITIRIGKSKKTSAKYYLKSDREILRLLQQVSALQKPFKKNYKMEL